MNFFKVIFLFIFFTITSYSATTWEATHAELVRINWQENWLEAVLKMECDAAHKADELTAIQRRKVLERFVNGRGRGTGALVADLAHASHPNIGAAIGDPLENYLNFHFIWKDIDAVGVLESGYIGSGPFRDRRFAAGWLFDGVDIIRQQPYTNLLLTEAQYGDISSNDLLKVQKLSGTFWYWEDGKDVDDAEEMFSGIIQPGQEISSDTANVISCFHGLMEAGPINELYFLPNGEAPVAENFFKIQDVQVGMEPHPLDAARITQLYIKYKNKEEIEEFKDNDYAIIRVSNNAVSGENRIQDILQRNHLFHAGDNHVANLQGEIEAEHVHFDRIFAFGKPKSPILQKASSDGFCLVSDVFNGNIVQYLKDHHDNGVVTQIMPPFREVSNPDQIFARNPTTSLHHIAGEPENVPETFQTIPIPFANGMSGGPVLMCKVDTHAGHATIKCRHIGVIQGGGLFKEGSHLLYKSVIATL
ncbi:MAG: hypothetical protein K2W94_06350 [Alphaproteobacteria bacterium]|nr:hypothetical protein [Alphaproteobacteria bacterium]